MALLSPELEVGANPFWPARDDKDTMGKTTLMLLEVTPRVEVLVGRPGLLTC